VPLEGESQAGKRVLGDLASLRELIQKTIVYTVPRLGKK